MWFQEILRECPYHLDSLLVMAEIMRHQEEYQVARDLIGIGENISFVCFIVM